MNTVQSAVTTSFQNGKTRSTFVAFLSYCSVGRAPAFQSRGSNPAPVNLSLFSQKEIVMYPFSRCADLVLFFLFAERILSNCLTNKKYLEIVKQEMVILFTR